MSERERMIYMCCNSLLNSGSEPAKVLTAEPLVSPREETVCSAEFPEGCR